MAEDRRAGQTAGRRISPGVIASESGRPGYPSSTPLPPNGIRIPAGRGNHQFGANHHCHYLRFWNRGDGQRVERRPLPGGLDSSLPPSVIELPSGTNVAAPTHADQSEGVGRFGSAGGSGSSEISAARRADANASIRVAALRRNLAGPEWMLITHFFHGDPPRRSTGRTLPWNGPGTGSFIPLDLVKDSASGEQFPPRPFSRMPRVNATVGGNHRG